MKSPVAPAPRVAAPVHEPQQHALPEGQEMEGLEGGSLSFEPADAVQRRQIQSAANESGPVQQMKIIQQAANASPQVQQAAQLKAAAQQFTGGPVQRKRPEESQGSGQPLQRKKGGDAPSLSGGGGGGGGRNNGLPDDLRAGVESLSGLDMADVQVHRNSAKPAAMGALAYAQGTDIHLGPGQEQHLPHEAWHVAQQKQGRVTATRQLKGVALNDDSALEKEADIMGAKALQMKASLGNGGGSGSSSEAPLKQQVQLKAKVAQAKLTIGTDEINPDLASKIDDATEGTDNEGSGIDLFAFGSTPHYLFKDFAEMKAYNASRDGLPDMGVWKDAFIRLNTAMRYILGEGHTESPKDYLYEKIHATNLVYEGDDHLGRSATGGTMNGKESTIGGKNGGIDHLQLQQLYIISFVISELQTKQEVDDYYVGVLNGHVDALTNASGLLQGGNAIHDYKELDDTEQKALLAALARDFTAILATTNTDLQGRTDPLTSSRTIAASLATELGTLSGAVTATQVGAQTGTVFGMRDHIMAGRIMNNTTPVIALMGAAHVPGVKALVTGTKMDFVDYKAMIESFKEGGAAFNDVKGTLVKATDIPVPKPQVIPPTVPLTATTALGPTLPTTVVDEDGFEEFRSATTNSDEDWDPFGEKDKKDKKDT